MLNSLTDRHAKMYKKTGLKLKRNNSQILVAKFSHELVDINQLQKTSEKDGICSNSRARKLGCFYILCYLCRMLHLYIFSRRHLTFKKAIHFSSLSVLWCANRDIVSSYGSYGKPKGKSEDD